MQVFADTNVILDFLEIKQLRLLVQLYTHVFVTDGVDRQIKSNRDSYEVWRDDFPIILPEPAWYITLSDMERKYGIGVGEVDRMAAIAAKYTNRFLLTRDNDLINEAIEYLGMQSGDFIGTVEILHDCVLKDWISKKEALMFCDDISEARCPREDLDKILIEDLPD